MDTADTEEEFLTGGLVRAFKRTVSIWEPFEGINWYMKHTFLLFPQSSLFGRNCHGYVRC